MASRQLTVQEERQQSMLAIRQTISGPLAPQFKAALPAHVPVEKFTRVALTALQNNPDLVTADRNSLFGAFVRLAQDGLLPDGREAAVVIFKGKAQAMPMIGGILKRIRQSGEVSYVSAQVVYERDRFKWSLGFDETIEHEPAPLDEEPGAPIAAYAVAVLKDGSRLCEVMRKSQIEKVRAVSRSGQTDGAPWKSWWDEMARKTVMRRLAKRLPMSTDLEEAFQRDDTMAHRETGEVVEMVREEQPRPMVASKLDMLEQATDHDPNTGEIDTGRDMQDMGETHTTADAEAQIMSHLARKVRVTDVDSLVRDRMGELDEDGQQRLRDAAQVQRDNILAGSVGA